jgi:glutamate--cysteine ligase catalytic subunit
VVNLTNIALLGSSHMQLDYDELITDKPRYQDMFCKLQGQVSHIDDQSDYEMQELPPSSNYEQSTSNITHAVDSWGGCGLQATFAADDLQEACRVHDQLVPLGPLMLALSAATPIYKGRLVATDTRWKAMSSKMPYLQPRSICTPIYLEETPFARQMSDRTMESAEGSMSDLRKQGVAPALATYFAHILGRKPLIETACMRETDETSNLAQDAMMDSLNVHMSTWWPHVRLKLPVLSTANYTLPWRVEFRPMEAQPSDMENAALVVALRLLQQTIQHFGLDLKIPISAVEENMNHASDRNAATDQIFRFAVRSLSSTGEPAPAFDGWASLNVIFNGNGDSAAQSWRGLLPLARDYLAHRNISSLSTKEQEKILGALELLSMRASGRLETPAKWMRRFVAENSGDGLRNEEIPPCLYYDMILALSG